MLESVTRSAAQGARQKHAGPLTRAAARGILVLLLVVPVLMILIVRERNILWILWSMVSLWTAVDAWNVAKAAFLSRSVYTPTLVIIGLAVANLLLSLCVVFVPIAPWLVGR